MSERDDAAGPRSLRDEIRQTRPFRSVSQEAFLSVLRTADVVKRRFAPLLASENVTFQQYNVLRILRGAGEDGLPTLEVGERMIERTPGVTRILDRLEKKGWVARGRGTEDRRRVWCRITPAGLALLERLDEPVNSIDAEIFEGFPEGDLRSLIELLDEVRARIGSCTEVEG